MSMASPPLHPWKVKSVWIINGYSTTTTNKSIQFFRLDCFANMFNNKMALGREMFVHVEGN